MANDEVDNDKMATINDDYKTEDIIMKYGEKKGYFTGYRPNLA